jgi:hypothetical protein
MWGFKSPLAHHEGDGQGAVRGTLRLDFYRRSTVSQGNLSRPAVRGGLLLIAGTSTDPFRTDTVGTGWKHGPEKADSENLVDPCRGRSRRLPNNWPPPSPRHRLVILPKPDVSPMDLDAGAVTA